MVLLILVIGGVAIFCFAHGYVPVGVICLGGFSKKFGFVALIITALFLFGRGHWIVGAAPLLLIVWNVVGFRFLRGTKPGHSPTVSFYTLTVYGRYKLFNLFSEDTELSCERMLSDCDSGFADDVDHDAYHAHYRALTIQLLDAAFSRTLSRDLRYTSWLGVLRDLLHWPLANAAGLANADELALPPELVEALQLKQTVIPAPQPRYGRCVDLRSLKEEYYWAFGSSSVDGVKVMSQLFAENLAGGRPYEEKVASYYYNRFYAILSETREQLGKITLVE